MNNLKKLYSQEGNMKNYIEWIKDNWQIEEYILPGGFVKFFNKNLLKVNADDKIVPVDREVSLWINLIYIWVVLLLFAGLGFLNLKFAAWIPYFFSFKPLDI